MVNDHCQQLTSGSLEDYVSNKYSESNWLTRMLTNKMSGRVDEDDLNDAKTIHRSEMSHWIN